jgi:hypothetical protein
LKRTIEAITRGSPAASSIYCPEKNTLWNGTLEAGEADKQPKSVCGQTGSSNPVNQG